MKKLIILFAIILCSLSAYSQSTYSVSFYRTGKTYKLNDLVSRNGIIYRANLSTTQQPPGTDWVNISTTAGSGAGNINDGVTVGAITIWNGTSWVESTNMVETAGNYVILNDLDVQGTLTATNLSGTNTGDQNASQVPFTPAGGIVATDVQGAIEEVNSNIAVETDPVFVAEEGDILKTNEIRTVTSEITYDEIPLVNATSAEIDTKGNLSAVNRRWAVEFLQGGGAEIDPVFTAAEPNLGKLDATNTWTAAQTWNGFNDFGDNGFDNASLIGGYNVYAAEITAGERADLGYNTDYSAISIDMPNEAGAPSVRRLSLYANAINPYFQFDTPSAYPIRLGGGSDWLLARSIAEINAANDSTLVNKQYVLDKVANHVVSDLYLNDGVTFALRGGATHVTVQEDMLPSGTVYVGQTGNYFKQMAAEVVSAQKYHQAGHSSYGFGEYQLYDGVGVYNAIRGGVNTFQFVFGAAVQAEITATGIEGNTIVKTGATSDDVLLGDGTTTSLAGLVGGGVTNLAYTPSPTNGIVTSDTGTDATIPLADGTNAGLITPAEKTAIANSVSLTQYQDSTAIVKDNLGAGFKIQGLAKTGWLPTGTNSLDLMTHDGLLGEGNTGVTGNSSLAIGSTSLVQGFGNLNVGNYNRTNQDFAVAIGYDTDALGYNAISLGYQNNITGTFAFGHGYINTNAGYGTAAFGLRNVIGSNGNYTFTAGILNDINDFGNVGLGTGISLPDNDYGRVAVGRANLNSNALFAVGNGSVDLGGVDPLAWSVTSRSDAFTVFPDGTAYLPDLSLAEIDAANDSIIATKGYVNQQVAAGGNGDVTAVPTPLDNQISVWTGSNTIEGSANLTWDDSELIVNGATSIGTVSSPTFGYSLDVSGDVLVQGNIDAEGGIAGGIQQTAHAGNYTTTSGENGYHIALGTASAVITLDDASVNVGNQFHFYNKTGGDVTWSFGTGDSAYQGALSPLGDGLYAWATLESANNWSVIVGGSGGGGGGTTLTALTDTNISSPLNGQVLTYNSTGSVWENQTLAGTGDMLQATYDTTGTIGIVDDAEALGGVTPTNYARTDVAETFSSTISATNLSGTNTGDNAVNTLYSGLVSNATHTGDVTGSTALTISTDAVDIPMLSATGTADATTFLRGDNTWAVPSGGGGGDVFLANDQTFTGVNKFTNINTQFGGGASSVQDYSVDFYQETNDLLGQIIVNSADQWLFQGGVGVTTRFSGFNDVEFAQGIRVANDPTTDDGVGNRDYNDQRYTLETNWALDQYDGSIVAGTGWTTGTDEWVALNATGTLRPNGIFSNPAGGYYTCEVRVSNYSQGELRVKIGDIFPDSNITGNGTYRYYAKTTTQDDLFELITVSNFSGTVTRIVTEGRDLDQTILPDGFSRVNSVTYQIGDGVGGTSAALLFDASGVDAAVGTGGTGGYISSGTSRITLDGANNRILLSTATEFDMNENIVKRIAKDFVTFAGTGFSISNTNDDTYDNSTIICTSASAKTITFFDTVDLHTGSQIKFINTGGSTMTFNVSGTTTFNGGAGSIVISNTYDEVIFTQLGDNTDDWLVTVNSAP